MLTGLPAWVSQLLLFATPRPTQRDGFNALETGADVLVIAATGSGKSLVFQLPAIRGWVYDVAAGVLLPMVACVVVLFIALGES